MLYYVVEIGLKHVTGALVEAGAGERFRLAEGPWRFDSPDWANFEQWLMHSMPFMTDADGVAVSTSGLLDPVTGVVRLLPAAKWIDRPLAANLSRALNQPVHVIADGEAHVHAHLSMFANPQLALAFDSTIAFGWANSDGRIVRPRPDRNFDIGEWQIPTHAESSSLWWALGDEGYLELLESEKSETGAMRHWGFRMGRFLISLAAVLQPRTIVLSGSRLTDHWGVVESSMRAAISKHKAGWLEVPAIVQSPFGAQSALFGMAMYLSRLSASTSARAA